MTSAPQQQSLPHRSFTLAGVPTGAEGLVLADIIAGKYAPELKPHTIVHVAMSDRHMETLAQALAFFAPAAQILHFPAWDCMPYDRVSPLPAIMASRMRTLAALSSPARTPRIVLTTANAVLQKLPPRDATKNIVFDLRVGQTLNRDALVSFLLAQGYRRLGKAMEPGEFALRGSIIDIVPSGMSEGIRMDLFGDDIESIRAFDPLTQITNNKVGSSRVDLQACKLEYSIVSPK